MNSEIKITDYESFKRAKAELKQELQYHEDGLTARVDEIKRKFNFVGNIISLFKNPMGGGIPGNVIYMALSKIVGMVMNKAMKSDGASSVAGHLTGLVKNYVMKYKDIFTNLAFNSVFNKMKKRRRKAPVEQEPV